MTDTNELCEELRVFSQLPMEDGLPRTSIVMRQAAVMIERLEQENAALRELVEGVPLYWAVRQEWIAKRDAILNGGAK